MYKIAIYLAGGMDGLSEKQQKGWREMVKDQLNERTEHLVKFLDPTEKCPTWKKNKHKYGPKIVKKDIECIVKSNLVIANDDTGGFGTAMEHVYASMHKIPLYAYSTNEENSIWVEYHAKKMFDNWNDLIDAVVEDFGL